MHKSNCVCLHRQALKPSFHVCAVSSPSPHWPCQAASAAQQLGLPSWVTPHLEHSAKELSVVSSCASAVQRCERSLMVSVRQGIICQETVDTIAIIIVTRNILCGCMYTYIRRPTSPQSTCAPRHHHRHIARTKHHHQRNNSLARLRPHHTQDIAGTHPRCHRREYMLFACVVK